MGSSITTDLPMKFLMPSCSDNVREIAFKTIPSVSKVEIKRVLESMCGLEVEKVRTLNMQGKKKWKGGHLIARPNYKKAYITLKEPLAIGSEFYNACAIVQDKTTTNGKGQLRYFDEHVGKSHWLDKKEELYFKSEKRYSHRGGSQSFARGKLEVRDS